MANTLTAPTTDDGPEAKAFLAARNGVQLKLDERQRLTGIRYREAMRRQKGESADAVAAEILAR